MIREVKAITLGSKYDFIQLDKYTNDKDSIKVEFEDTGHVLNNWILNDFGSLEIERGILDYNKYENPYEIKVIVEYEESELPLTLKDINTLEGLTENIVNLKSFDYIRDIRLVANRKFNIKLNEFVLFNAVLFDQFGQAMKLTYRNQESYNYKFNNIITLEEFKSNIEEFSYGSGAIPNGKDYCSHCNQDWELINLRDCTQREGHKYHIECNKFSLYEKVKKEFEYIASRAFNNYQIYAIKNEYGSDDYNGCWFIIKTSEGDIKIGWRKRVIQIKWLQNYKPFSFDGKEDDVTKKFSKNERYIHAWNIDDAIKYLNEAKETIVKY